MRNQNKNKRKIKHSINCILLTEKISQKSFLYPSWWVKKSPKWSLITIRKGTSMLRTGDILLILHPEQYN